MTQASHQTIKLSKGKHASPTDGACVMELASMLAGEPFTDHPRSVSRPIGSFLRCYNDLIDDGRRQDLYVYASKAVGSAATADVEQARLERLVQWGTEMREQRFSWRVLMAIRRGAPARLRRSDAETAARYAIGSICRLSEEVHASVLALIDDLLTIGTSELEASNGDWSADPGVGDTGHVASPSTPTAIA